MGRDGQRVRIMITAIRNATSLYVSEGRASEHKRRGVQPVCEQWGSKL